jgi:glycosyltransferase involved in cell wall biosynthesis
VQTVTVIIPAFNEAARVSGVLAVVRQATLAHEILVVDDGSQDNTAEVVAAGGIRVLRLPENRGKGTALRAGALAVQGDILLFLDADLQGLTPAQVDDLIRPVLQGQADMSVGIFQQGRTATDLAQWISPSLSGQRCLSRAFFLAVPLIDGSHSGVEIILTAHARACKLRVTLVPLAGVTHTMKEEKLGLLRGILSRWRMYGDILAMLLRYRLATRVAGRASVSTK